MDTMAKSFLVQTPLFILIFIINLNATTYYVDNDGGNDGNAGTSTSAPWKSLAKIQSTSFAAGDIVSFKCGGRFSGTTISGKSNITFNSYGAGAKPVIDGQSARNCFDLQYQSNVTFNNLRIVNGYPTNVNLWHPTSFLFESCNIDSSKGADIHYCNIYSGYGSGLTVRNSTLSYGAQTSGGGNLGIYIDQTQNTLLEHDTLIGNFSNIRVAFGDGSSGYDFTRGLIVRYCIVKNGQWDNVDDDGSYAAQFYYNVFESGIGSQYHVNIYFFSDGSGTHSTFAPKFGNYYNNTFIQRGGNVIFSMSPDIVLQTEGMQFYNNIIYNTNGSEFWEDITPWSGFNVIFNHNIYSADGTWRLHNVSKTFAQWQAAGYDLLSKCTDPLFTNYASGDYTLQTGSPSINAGANLGLAIDINGNSVPSNYPDLGAYQHNSGSGGGGGGGALPKTTLTLTALIEALYSAGGTAMTISPIVTVELHSATIPFGLVDSNTAALDKTGTGTFTFTKAVSGTGYYIVVKSINTIETWSANPQSFVSSVLSYNFTTAATQAYTDGSNPPLALHNGKFCIYSGDLNQDGFINSADYTGVDNDNSTFSFHQVNDLNGNGVVSTADEQFIDNNYKLLIHKQVPPGTTGNSSMIINKEGTN